MQNTKRANLAVSPFFKIWSAREDNSPLRAVAEATFSRFARVEPLSPEVLILFNSQNAKRANLAVSPFLNVVGERGFEPPTHWSQTSCATKLRYSPNAERILLLGCAPVNPLS